MKIDYENDTKGVMIMRKITILFGAGAEGKGQFGLPSGKDFKRDVILAKDVELFANLFLQNAKSKIKLNKGTIISAQSSSILYQTILEGKNIETNLKELFPDQNDRDIAVRYLEYKKNNTSDKNISQEFKKLYHDNFYDAIIGDKGNTNNDEIAYFLQKAGIYAFLDSLFNYLRKPETYKNECARVIKVYYAAFLSILNGMAKRIRDNKQLIDIYSTLIQGEEGISDLQGTLAKVIDGFQNEIIKNTCFLTREEKSKLYYCNIRKLIESGNNVVSCVTTNYTNIGQRVMQLPDEHFSYLHGKLGLFEELETKNIVNIEKMDLKKTVFPYLLVQSGVKPIISPFQIQEFYKACKMIIDADDMLIIGYGVNSEDEHISNILRARLEDGKRIKHFVYYKKKEEWENETTAVKAQLGYDDLLDFHSADEFGEIISKMNSCQKSF